MSQLMKKRFPSITSIDVGSDGNTSFLRAARNGQLDKVLEHLKTNIDINTSNANGLNALHLASKDGHVAIVSELLKRGAAVDAATKKGNTALHIASLAGQEEVVRLLVAHGASVNVQSQNGFTPLYMAAQENHDRVVRFLLASGANQALSTEDGFTPLAVAMQQGHEKVVTVLLENDSRGKVRLPALHIAAKKDDVKAAKLLLENDHNPDVTSKSGFTPLHIASHYGNQAIANLLVQKGADVNYAAKHNITPLHVAAKWGKSNMVTVLLEQGATIDAKTRDGLTPLHCAARSGHEQVVDMLLEKGAPISSKTKNGLAPLHMAAQGDHVDAARILLYHRAPVDEVTVDYLTALHVAAHCGHVKVAKLLLDRQADANARALNGFTPLHIACKKNRIKVVELLLKHGASIGATTESGLTPLHVASFMGCMNIVIYLLQHDASPDAPTVRGETPLHLAARANQTDIIRILLRNGAQVDARAREQQTPLHIASRLGNVDIVMLLLQHGAKVDTTTKDLYTALHIAAKEGQEDVATALIENGASVTATTKKGFTPLHLAAKYGHLKVAKLLLQKEAPVDAQGKNGVTPLHVASHYDHQNVALLLLEKGASPYATAKNGYTPLHIAAKKNQMDIANTLLEYGAKPNAESKAGFTPLHLTGQEGHCELSELLIEHKAEPNYNSKNGLTPLHLCAQDDRVPVAEVLVKNGAKVDAETKNGYTPLHIAAHYGQANMVRFLLKHGADVHAKTGLGYSPLHHAAQQGHTGIVNLLLENGAQPNVRTNSGQTPLDIAQKLGYITVIDTLKVITEEPTSPQLGSDEKYRVVAPEAMQETFMSDSEEEGEDTVLAGDQTYRYLTADEMKSLGDDSLPIDVTRDERIDSNKFVNNENSLPPRHIEDAISPEHIHQNYVEYIKKYTPDNIEINRHPINIGKLHWKNFLVSFLVDARGGAMRGCRHSGVRVIVPPRCASSPTRITCRYVRPQRTPHPPPLMEGEALASRVLELGPVGAKFLGPVIIEVPHFAALRGKEREIVILRSDNGETWKEHTIDATEEVLNEVLHDSFEVEDLNQLEDVSSGRITRIITQDFPQYFAVVSRIRQEVHAIGPEGGMVSSTVVPQVQAVFPQGALTKKIKVGLQVQPIDPELTVKLLGHGVAVSPVVTVEPRRRKFHKAITLSMPTPRAHSQGMINQYSGNAPTLRLLCSITGGTTRAQWEDVTGSTPLTFVNDCVSFTTTVSARFWLMDCRNVGDATKMATELYRDAIHVPFMAKFVVFAKRVDPLEARLRVFCMTDDKEDKTLEHQEHFTEVAKSRDVEVLENKPQYIEFAGNLVPITKSGEQLQFAFRAFRENRLPFSVRVKDQHAEAVCRALFMRESKQPKGEPPQQPICILNIVLPDDIVVDTISLTDSYTDSSRKLDSYDYYRPDPRLADVSNLLGDDWVRLASQLGLTASEINVIKSEYPESTAKQAQSMLRMWLSQSGNKAQTDTLELALRRIGREDIVPHCLNEPTISTKPKLPRIPSSEGLKEKYLAEEKVFEEEENNSEEEDFNKTVEERRQQIEQRLERAAPASMQRVEIVQEITNIKRQSLVENKIAVVESARRDSELLEGVTEAIRRTSVPKIQPKDDLKSPKVMKTPPPSPADFILKEQRATIPEWDVSRKSTTGGEEPSASIDVDAEQQGQPPTTTVDLEAMTSINDKKADDNKNNANEKKKSKKGFFGSIKTFVERSFESDSSDTEKSPKKTKAKKEKKKKELDAQAKITKPRLPTPPLDIQDPDIEFADLPLSQKPPPVPSKETKPIIEPEQRSPSLPPKKKRESTPILIEEVTKRIDPWVIESEEFSIIVDPTRKESPKKSKEILTINIDRSIEEIEKELLGKSPILPEESIVKPIATLYLDSEPVVIQDDVYEDIEPVISVPPPNLDALQQQREVTFAPEEPERIIEEIVEKQDNEVSKEKEESGKKKGGFFGLFRRKESKKDEESHLPEKKISDEVLKQIEDSSTFIRTELENYEDAPPVVLKTLQDEYAQVTKKEVKEDTEEPVKEKEKEESLSPKSSPSFFGRFKKPKKEQSSEKPVTVEHDPLQSAQVLQDVQDVNKSLTQEVEQYNDNVKEEVQIVEEAVTETSIEQPSSGFFGLFKKSKKDEDQQEEPKLEHLEVEREASPKPGGFLGLFKKPKRDEEEAKAISEEIQQAMTETKNFLSKEVEEYNDTKPAKFPPLDVVKEEQQVADSSPKPSRGIFGIFAKGKEEETKVEEVLRESSPKPGIFSIFKKTEEHPQPALSEEVIKDMEKSTVFLQEEVDKYHDVRPIVTESIITQEITEVESSKPSKGIFGIFKKTSKEEKPHEDETIAVKETVRTVDEPVAESPKPAKSIFGIFKKSKDETAGSKPLVSEAAAKDIDDSRKFLTGEVDNYHDAKPETQLKPVEELVVVAETTTEEIKSELEEHKETVKQSKTLEESPSKGLFGIFKKSKEPVAPHELSDEVRQNMEDSKDFLNQEVENYHDVQENVSNIIAEEVSQSPKPSRGLFGIFKKSKDGHEHEETEKGEKAGQVNKHSGFFGIFKTTGDEKPPEDGQIEEAIVHPEELTKPVEQTNVVLAQEVVESMQISKEFLQTEVEKYHDEKQAVQGTEVIREESPKRHSGLFGIFKKTKEDTQETVDDTLNGVREVSPKRGILGIFKKSKDDSSDDHKKAVEDSEQFINQEIEKYHDVKPSTVEEVREASPKRHSGLFGIFKKSKDQTSEEEIENVVETVESSIEHAPRETTPKRTILDVFKKSKEESEEIIAKPSAEDIEVQKAKEDSQHFLKEEVDRYHDVKISGEIKEKGSDDVGIKEPETEGSRESPHRHSGFFGLFKKKEESAESKKTVLSEQTVKEMDETKQFLTEEVEKYHDVLPERIQNNLEDVEAITDSPKSSRGLFGIFKKSKEPKSEETPVVEQKLKEESVEASPKPSRGLFGLFKGERDEVESETKVLSENVAKDMEHSKQFLSDEVQNYHDVMPAVEQKLDEVLVEEKITKHSDDTVQASPKSSRGIFGLFKKSKGKEEEEESKEAEPTQATEEIPPETQPEDEKPSFLGSIFHKSIDRDEEQVELKPALSVEAIETINETRQFIIDEVGNYEQEKTKPEPGEKEEPKQGFLKKFKKTKKKLSAQQFSVEIFNDMEDTKNFIRTELEHYEDAVREVPKEDKSIPFEEVSTSDDARSMITVIEATPKETAESKHSPAEDAKKTKKDKKGFFNIFTKKSKSTDATHEDHRSEDASKKAKHRKSGSPFKFFEKSRRSEDLETIADFKDLGEIAEPKPIDEDLLAVEFEEQPALNLSDEVLQSLERKIEEMKKNYSEEAVQDINDCRDFLFIEKDSYEDAKPIIITDIDSDWPEQTPPQTVQISDLDEPVQKPEKKQGFFSKLGHFISDTKSDAKKTASKIAEEVDSKTDDAKSKTEKQLSSTEDAVSKAKDAVDDVTAQTIKDLSDNGNEFVQGIDGLFGSVKDRTTHKIDEVSKGTTEIVNGTKQSVVETHQTVTAAADEELKKAKDSIIQAVETTKDTVRKTGDELAKLKDETDQEVTKTKDETLKVFSQNIDETKQEITETKEEITDATNKSIIALEKSKEQLETATTDKVEQAKITAESLKQQTTGFVQIKLDDINKTKAAVSQQIVQTVDANQGKLELFTEESKQRIEEEVKSNIEEAKQTTLEGAKKVTFASKEQILDFAEGAERSASEKVAEVTKTTKEKADNAAQVAEGSKQLLADKITEQQQQIVTSAAEAGESLAAIQSQAHEEAMKVKEETKEKVDQSLKDTGKKIEEGKAVLSEAKDRILEAEQRLFDLSAKYVESGEERLSELKTETTASVDQAIMSTDIKVDVGKEVLKQTAEQILEEKQKLLDSSEKKLEAAKDQVSEVKKDLIERVDELVLDTAIKSDQCKIAASEAISETKRKVEDVADKKIVATTEKIAEMKTDTKETIDNTVKSGEKYAEDVTVAASGIFGKITRTIESEITPIKEKGSEVKSKIDEAVTATTKNIEDVTNETTRFASEAKHKVTDIAEQKADSVKEKAGEIKADLEQRSDEALKITEKTIDSGKQATLDKISEVQHQAAETIDSGLETANKAISDIQAETKHKLDETAKFAEKSLEASKQTAAVTIDNVLKGQQETHLAKEQVSEKLPRTLEGTKQELEDQSKLIGSTFAITKQALEDSTRKTEQNLTQLKDEAVAKLDELSKSSYVTSPTAARRAASQRYSSEERPAVREVISSQQHSTDEELYTVTEPEEKSKRKAIFHLESEDDESVLDLPQRERRDSAKSNVLETLSETKLSTVLASLESQLVKDLEDSVLGGTVDGDSGTKKSAVVEELEQYKKDSESDVEQIEKKLRDLDEALGTLEKDDHSLDKKLHRVERKFERMASEIKSPTEPSEKEFQKLVSQMSTEEVSDFQREYGHLWDETTFTKSDELDSSKTPDSLVDELSQGEGTSSGQSQQQQAQESTLKAEDEEQSNSQRGQRPVSDQHQLSDEMKQLLQELERESKQ